MKSPRRILTSALCLALLALSGCNKSDTSSTNGSAGMSGKKPKIAYITNGVDPFWNTAAAGVRAAAKEFGVDAEVHMPAKGIVDQKRLVESLLAGGVDGIAISPIDAKNQVDLINQACRATKVITHDSDAPDSQRLCFVGMDNYKAGRAAGKLIKEAIPNGGKVMIFVGRLEQLNSQQRRQGIIDELLDKPVQSLTAMTYDLPGKVLAGTKYTVLDTRTDNFDYARAKSNAEDAITANADLACMVGLFAYNPPACLEALKSAKKNGQIKLVAFDEQNATLQGILDGDIHGTVSQQPYYYGYNSVKILAGLARGDQSVLPKGGFQEVEIVQVRKDNAQKFWSELKKLQAGG
ncbi:MAG TPA: sugar-binding protein [Candidatus Acidoferrum sp.]|nr:sugar-binding protein [Candidatus Acidoferrum sp.]